MNEQEQLTGTERPLPSEQSPDDHGTVEVETEYSDEVGREAPRPSEQSPGDHGAPVNVPNKPY